MTHPELVETELAPGVEQLGGDADAIAASSAQQVLDAVAQAVSREGSAGSSALAPIPQARPEAGFTLAELLVVVGIVVGLAAVILPNVGRFTGEGERGSLAFSCKGLEDGRDVRW